MNWEIGIDMYTLICIKWITNKNLLYKRINKINSKDKKIKNKNKYSQGKPHNLSQHSNVLQNNTGWKTRG